MQGCICDISEQGALRLAGDDAPAFLSVMYAGDLESCSEIGGLSQGAFLNAEGQVIDVVMVMRTGKSEYLLTGSEDNRAELFEWLSAHAALSDEKGRVFADVTLEDQSAHIGILLMAGQGAAESHDELMAACEGQVFLIEHRFDELTYGIPCAPSWLVFAPVNVAAQIGDFLQEYPELCVLDRSELDEALERAGVAIPALHGAQYALADEEAFAPYLRTGNGFVGARALGR